jgi:uncharacterized membrane protein YfcA
MPVLVIAFGPLQAVPVMAIAAIMANFSRIVVWWREVDWRAAGAFAATGAPAAALGAVTLLSLPVRAIEVTIGAFFIAMIFVRRWMAARKLRFTPLHLALFGAPLGFITGIVVSTGPLTVPIFIGAGYQTGAFISTEAAATLAVYLSKTAVFGTLGALPPDIVLKGLIVGSTLMLGAWIAKRIVLRIPPERFNAMMDGLMLVSGAALLAAALV